MCVIASVVGVLVVHEEFSLYRDRDRRPKGGKAHTSSSISNREKPPYFGSASPPEGGAGGAVLPIATSLEDCIEGGGGGTGRVNDAIAAGDEVWKVRSAGL